MMLGSVKTVAFHGFNVVPIDVQAHIGSGLPAFNIVGLADKSVAESKERIRSALSSIGCSFPSERITVNLSPADLPKEGTHFDLPIALALLTAMNVIPQDAVSNYISLGELSLDSSIVAVDGVLPAASYAFSSNFGIICPIYQGGEAAWIEKLEVLAPKTLLTLMNYFNGKGELERPKSNMPESKPFVNFYDLSDIKGQESAKRALEITASGGHNMLMVGPPGTGKSMLASALIGILPDLFLEESLEVSKIYSLAGQLNGRSLIRYRPYRAPHHSASMPALIGGGKKVRPGEITLAHCGILFLDELPEFQRNVLDSLRQPIETGVVSVSRVNAHVDYPARFQLIAAMNPCRCGHLSDANLACNKAPECAVNYQNKISGPLLDRFDIHVPVPAIPPHQLSSIKSSEPSINVKKRVESVRKLQLERYKNTNIKTNAEANGKILEDISIISEKARKLLEEASEKFNLSGRGYHRTIKVARTIADMEYSEVIKHIHMAEALSYRYHKPARPK